jgi:hypothetical protein
VTVGTRVGGLGREVGWIGAGLTGQSGTAVGTFVKNLPTVNLLLTFLYGDKLPVFRAVFSGFCGGIFDVRFPVGFPGTRLSCLRGCGRFVRLA